MSQLRWSDGWIVRRATHAEAAALIRRLHYSGGAANTSVLAMGLFSPSWVLVGTCLWMPPAPGVAKWAAKATGCDPSRVITLSRMAVEDDIGRNAASMLIGRSVRELRADGWQVGVTYADTGQGHEGGVYLACNWTPCGSGGHAYEWRDESGRLRSRYCSGSLSPDDCRSKGWTRTKAAPKRRFAYAIDRRYRRAVARLADSSKP